MKDELILKVPRAVKAATIRAGRKARQETERRIKANLRSQGQPWDSYAEDAYQDEIIGAGNEAGHAVLRSHGYEPDNFDVFFNGDSFDGLRSPPLIRRHKRRAKGYQR